MIVDRLWTGDGLPVEVQLVKVLVHGRVQLLASGGRHHGRLAEQLEWRRVEQGPERVMSERGPAKAGSSMPLSTTLVLSLLSAFVIGRPSFSPRLPSMMPRSL